MPLFGRREREEPKDIPAELPPLSILDQTPFIPTESPPPVKKEPEKPAVAPLFVKIDRYRQILTAIGNLKTAIIIVKNCLATLQQIEKVRDNTFTLVNDIIERMDDKLIALDNALLRPAGFHESEEISPEHQDIRSIEATVADLQGQIEQLKAELGKVI